MSGRESMLMRGGRSTVLWLAAAALVGCGGSAPKRQRPTAEPVVRDVEPALRGLVGSMATLRGREPVLVSGYGIVVGLDGTGSSDMPVNIRAFMEREMAARGVGQISMGFGDITPTEMLNDPNTAVVQVSASIPPGSPEGASFEVFVRALPGSATTSLDGGRLWTTDLHRGVFTPGGPTPITLARASGPIFINPFVDLAAGEGAGAVSATTGRILAGGRVIEPLDLVLVLDNPSHARSRSIVSAINARFPQAPSDRRPAAEGRNEEVIELHVPDRFKNDTDRFIQLVLHTRVDQGFAQEWAVRYTRAMVDEPSLAPALAWALQALGPGAIPEIRRLYDHAELAPRLAALEAGAGLRDPLVEPPLVDLATTGPPALRAQAIALLGRLDPDPSTNMALRGLLESGDLDIRVAAYEALRERFDPAIERRDLEDKLILEVAPFGDPLVYVTQHGEPRIVVFGERAGLTRPMFISAWDGRLLIDAGPTDPTVRVFHRDARTGRSTTASVRPDLVSLIEFAAHTTTPEAPAPGLGLSYSRVVGLLHEVWKAGGFADGGAFVTEQDRLFADLLRSTQTLAADDRPETDSDAPGALTPESLGAPGSATAEPAQAPQRRTFVVPLKRPTGQRRQP